MKQMGDVGSNRAKVDWPTGPAKRVELTPEERRGSR